MEKPVEILNYNPEQSLEFQQEERKIREIVDNKLIAIENIGSTAVQGLGAKPIIDMMVGVKDLLTNLLNL